MTVTVPNYYGEGDVELRFHQVRKALTDFLDGDMMTIDYVGVIPGQGVMGDIEAIVEVYNPENTSWRAGDYDYIIIEYARFGWGEQTIQIGDNIIHFDQIDSNGVKEGYFTYHYYLDGK